MKVALKGCKAQLRKTEESQNGHYLNMQEVESFNRINLSDEGYKHLVGTKFLGTCHNTDCKSTQKTTIAGACQRKQIVNGKYIKYKVKAPPACEQVWCHHHYFHRKSSSPHYEMVFPNDCHRQEQEEHLGYE